MPPLALARIFPVSRSTSTPAREVVPRSRAKPARGAALSWGSTSRMRTRSWSREMTHLTEKALSRRTRLRSRRTL